MKEEEIEQIKNFLERAIERFRKTGRICLIVAHSTKDEQSEKNYTDSLLAIQNADLIDIITLIDGIFTHLSKKVPEALLVWLAHKFIGGWKKGQRAYKREDSWYAFW